MRYTEKKELQDWCKRFYNLVAELETLQTEFDEIMEEHESWMSDRDCDTNGRFSETPTGERAQEDYDTIESASSDLEDALDSLRDAIEPVSDLVNQ